jgi:hypothetical protein
MTPFEHLHDAACGDPEAQVRLAKAALAASQIEGSNPVISTVEGLTFARLAAAQGNLAALGLVVTLSAQLSDLLVDVGMFDDAATMEGQGLGAADIATDKVGEESLGEILGAYLSASSNSDPASAPHAASARRFWEGM